jgi:hypothetical protein
MSGEEKKQQKKVKEKEPMTETLPSDDHCVG